MNLETGEALVSFLDEKGAPSVVQRAKILFPLSQIGAITPEQRGAIIYGSPLRAKYDTPIDRESAFEQLIKEAEEQAVVEVEEAPVAAPKGKGKEPSAPKETKKKGIGSKLLKSVMIAVTGTLATAAGTAVSDAVSGKKTKSKTSVGQKIVKNTTSTVTRTLTRDILGNLLK